MTSAARDEIDLICPPDRYPAKDQYQAHLFEQYKMLVEGAERISERRINASAFFATVNSALLGVIGAKDHPYLWLMAVGGLGMTLLWFIIITSYRNLNTAKFALIHRIETTLPLRIYAAEWQLLGKGTDSKLYRPLSHVERVVPAVFAVLYLIILVELLR